MGVMNVPMVAFNRGLISNLALARTDIKRTALSAEEQTNWMPRVLGSMMLRPGFKYIAPTRGSLKGYHIPFIFTSDDTAIVELTNSLMRVRVNEEIISRTAVSSVVTNSTFDTDLSGWTDADEAGAVSDWVAGGYMGLTGNGISVALRTQQVTVGVSDRGVEHALRIVVERGPVKIRIGSTSGDDDYIREAILRTGTYSLAFTPTGDFYIWLFNETKNMKLISSVAVESAGEMQLTTPWGNDDLQYVRYDQSGDVIFVACDGLQQRRIERYGTRSWGIAIYSVGNGPFRSPNTTSITLTPSALSGNITLTSSFNLFKSNQVGALFKITSIGQNVDISAGGNGQWSDPIEVTGVSASRTFTVYVAGTWTGEITLQRSIGAVGSWEDSGTSFSANGTYEINDALDNQIIYYRVGFSSGYGSGTADLGMSYSSGGLTGICRITAYSSPTSVSAEVLTAFGAISSSVLWSEGSWSDYRGWPSAVAFDEGRLWWAGNDNIWASVTDAFENFNDETVGDSGPISRSLGSGPVSRINWLLALNRLVIGTDTAERVARSSSLDEPLTPTNFNLKKPSTKGSSPVAPAQIDTNGIFVNTDTLFQLSYQGGEVDFTSEDLTVLCPEIGSSGFVRIAVQRYPDTRIHCVRNDGKVGVLIFDPAEDVKCWVPIETDGIVEDVFVLPKVSGETEDKIYYVTKRTVNGSTVRYLERWALESECVGSTLNKQADSFIIYSGASTATITGLDHLEGEEVVVWANGRDFSPLDTDGTQITYTVTSGSINLGESVTNAVVGLPYRARYKSTKPAYGAVMGTALTQVKLINKIGLILINTHNKGLRYGSDFDNLDDLPRIEDGAIVDEDYVWPYYDKRAFEFPGNWEADPRICLEAMAPRPCTIAAAIPTVRTNEQI